MELELIINIAITAVCLLVLGMYFNMREKKIHAITESKLKDIKEVYISQIARRKVKEKKEIEKLKHIVLELEDKHRQILLEKKSQQENHHKNNDAEVEKMLKKAEEKAKQIENEMRENARKFLEAQKQEVQVKMVDLVMGVAKKVIPKSLTYEQHKELVEKAFLEVEGESSDDD